jgi:hypothetical protein
MGCDGIWEKKSNEEQVKWVYEQIDLQKNKDNTNIDIKKIVADLLIDNLAVVVSGKY